MTEHELAKGARPLSTDAAIHDLPRVRALLVAAARAGEAVSYSAFLAQLGLRFSRPKMRALCRALDRIDEAGVAAGEPELAVLVVRESDGLPGQGWWAGGRALAMGHDGEWTGREARALVTALQRQAFKYWANDRVARRQSNRHPDDNQDPEPRSLTRVALDPGSGPG